MTLLDIGCNASFFCIEAKPRNADYVLGVYEREGYVRRAKFASNVQNLEIDYKQMNFYDRSDMDSKYDIVLALRLIYQCMHPLPSAENIASVCKNSVIVKSQLIKSSVILEKLFMILKTFFKSFSIIKKKSMWQFAYDGYNS